MAATSAQTARGALAGAIAAGVWAAQQPLDKRVFGVDYDDAELLGKAVTRGPAWLPIGTAMHVANGALFGAAYANVAPRMPLPSWARGPVAALAEHVATWPLTIVADAAAPGAQGDAAAVEQPARVRAGDVAPPAVRVRARRARAAAERARGGRRCRPTSTS